MKIKVMSFACVIKCYLNEEPPPIGLDNMTSNQYRNKFYFLPLL